MKKLFSLVSLAALVLTVGCSEDQTTDQPIAKQGTLHATTEASTRTALDGTKVVWSTDDKLGMVTADAPETIKQYTLSSEAGKPTGEFTGDALTGTGEVYAFYPYDAAITCTDGAFNFTLPATQKFTANSFANNALPMVSRSTATNELMFKNLMGAVKFQAGGSQTVSRLTVTTTGEKIAGAASVAMNYTDAPKLVMDANGTTSITLTEVNTMLTGTPVSFYIALPAGEYAAGMKFELKDNNDAVIWSIITSKPLTITRSQVASLTPVDASNFPNAAFRTYLKKQGFVLTADGTDIDITNESNLNKFAEITKIDCSDNQITSLKGIEYFTALKTLNCSNNQLTSLDVNKCTALTSLNCSNNRLTSLDIKKKMALTELRCNENQLAILDVSECIALTTLNCHFNQLTSLNVNGCTALLDLNCGGNQLTVLDVSGCIALTSLGCNDNQLTTLNASGCTVIGRLHCPSNQLKTLNVLRCTAMTELNCDDNQLTTLNVSECTALQYFYCSDNKLATLDVRSCTTLEQLYCCRNQMSVLDISANTRMTSLICGMQTSDGITTQTLTLRCNETQFSSDDIGGFGTDNTGVKKILKE